MNNPRYCQNCGRECTNAAGWGNSQRTERIYQELGGGNDEWMRTAARALLLAVLGCERLTAAGCGAKFQKRKRSDNNETGR